MTLMVLRVIYVMSLFDVCDTSGHLVDSASLQFGEKKQTATVGRNMSVSDAY